MKAYIVLTWVDSEFIPTRWFINSFLGFSKWLEGDLVENASGIDDL